MASADDAQCLKCTSTSNTDQRLDRGQEFALKTEDSLSVKLTCWELQVGQNTVRAERQYEHVSDCCQIRALHMPNLLCLYMNFWPKTKQVFPFQKLKDSLKENKTSFLNNESCTMAKHPELQTMHFTGNGCAIIELIDPSPKETALNGATMIRR